MTKDRSTESGTVTVQDIARAARVSVGTVSRVFNNHANVTDALRQRVLTVASEIGYVGTSGQGLNSRVQRHGLKEICLLQVQSPEVTNDGAIATNQYWAPILHGAESELRKEQLKLVYKSVSADNALLPTLAAWSQQTVPDGVILVDPNETAAQAITLLQQAGVFPIVLLDNMIPHAAIDAVLGDNFGGARSAVSHLIRQGHREIAFIGVSTRAGLLGRPVAKIYTVGQRQDGYRMALLDAGLPLNDALCVHGNLNADGGYAACMRLLEQHVPFSAIFCANDTTAIGAIKALHDRGLRVPGDVSVVGFDDMDIARHLTPALTTVRLNKEALGATAVKRLIERARDPAATPTTSLLDVALIERESVRAR